MRAKRIGVSARYAGCAADGPVRGRLDCAARAVAFLALRQRVSLGSHPPYGSDVRASRFPISHGRIGLVAARLEDAMSHKSSPLPGTRPLNDWSGRERMLRQRQVRTRVV